MLLRVTNRWIIIVKTIYLWLGVVTLAALALRWNLPIARWLFLLLVPAWLLALQDSLQREHTLRRNYPLVSRARWIAEYLCPCVRQYFIESETDGSPISRMFRSIVYQRAKRDNDTNPFGTKVNVYRDGYEWFAHSMGAVNVEECSSHPHVLIWSGKSVPATSVAATTRVDLMRICSPLTRQETV